MRRLKRLAGVAGVMLAGLVYLWVSAVRAVPGVKRRKEERRAKRTTARG